MVSRLVTGRCYSVKDGMFLAYVQLAENFKRTVDVYFPCFSKNLEFIFKHK